MTVKELKEILANYDDNAEIEVLSCTDVLVEINGDVIIEKCD